MPETIRYGSLEVLFWLQLTGAVGTVKTCCPGCKHRGKHASVARGGVSFYKKLHHSIFQHFHFTGCNFFVKKKKSCPIENLVPIHFNCKHILQIRAGYQHCASKPHPSQSRYTHSLPQPWLSIGCPNLSQIWEMMLCRQTWIAQQFVHLGRYCYPLRYTEQAKRP